MFTTLCRCCLQQCGLCPRLFWNSHGIPVSKTSNMWILILVQNALFGDKWCSVGNLSSSLFGDFYLHHFHIDILYERSTILGFHTNTQRPLILAVSPLFPPYSYFFHLTSSFSLRCSISSITSPFPFLREICQPSQSITMDCGCMDCIFVIIDLIAYILTWVNIYNICLFRSRLPHSELYFSNSFLKFYNLIFLFFK